MMKRNVVAVGSSAGASRVSRMVGARPIRARKV
jgi:hypothetical protein